MISTILNHFHLTPHDFALQTIWTIEEIEVKRPYNTYGYMPTVKNSILVDAIGKKWRYMGSLHNDIFSNVTLLIFNPLVHGIAITAISAYRTLRILILYPLLSDQEKPQTLKERATIIGIEALQVLSAPFLLVALEIVAFYGIYKPRDGLKLHQSIEILTYGQCWALSSDIILKPLKTPMEL